MFTKADLLHDLIVTIPLSLWVLFVVQYFSRWTYNFAIKKGYPLRSATYFGRKTIHIFAPGLIALLIPFLFKGPLFPFLSALFMAIYTYLPHKTNQLSNWFQVRENIYEVNFSVMWGLVILIGWFLDKSFWLGVIPALFVSLGDGVTGIVRNIKYRRRTKAWEGSLAMLFVCVLIGLKMGWAGIIAALSATIVEKIEGIDDNVSIVTVSFLVLIAFFYFFPHLTKSLI